MSKIQIHTFKDSFGPTIELLNETGIKYQIDMNRSGTIMASSSIIEVIGNPAIWVSIASIIVAFIKAKNNRSVKITTEDNNVIEATGLNSKQLQNILENSKSISMIDTGNNHMD